MNKKGFTLIEILITLSIFSVVILISMDIFLRSFASQRRIIEMQNVQREGFYAMEIMSREIRMARFVESQSSDETESINEDSSFYFNNYEDDVVEFCRSDDSGLCTDDDTGDYIAYGIPSNPSKGLILSSDVKVENLKFYVSANELGNKQPIVTIVLTLASSKSSGVKIDMQTAVAMRIYN